MNDDTEPRAGSRIILIRFKNRWRAEADETENYTYAIALQNEA